jgi:voltage-gated potassium channel Kch
MKIAIASLIRLLVTMKAFALRHQRFADRLNVLASLSTFIFVASLELPQPSNHVLQLGFLVHEVVWLLYLVYVLIYFDSSKPIKFIREHFPEVLIALTWFPYAFQLTLGVWEIPYSVFHLIGVTAHAWLLSRSGRQRWGEHPFFAAMLCALSFLLFSSALIREVEPESFQNFPTAIYFILETLSTVGYGDLVPRSTAGKFVAVLAMFFGTGLFSALNGFVTEWIHQLVADKKIASNEIDLYSLAQKFESMKALLERVEQNQAEILRRLDKLDSPEKK